MSNPITEFQDKYRWLSNFWPCPIETWSNTFPSVEHAYQANKIVHAYHSRWDDPIIKQLCNLSPGQAKRLAAQAPKSAWWTLEFKLQTMEDLLRIKFTQEPFRSMLAATAPAELIEGNSWGDTFWGVCGGVGENHLGRLIMLIRNEIVSSNDIIGDLNRARARRRLRRKCRPKPAAIVARLEQLDQNN